ncbi:hypothetical protein [Amaricoccus sp.]|uniref:hypothetical protein n=1 Tax=Amaricoccus sp. TaxID=1872485 RepID=UPI002D1FB72C|nr:hypothetical protein [Amaricoccus sp.]
MRNGFILLAAAALAAGCSMEMPDFLGREGGGGGFYNVRGTPPPEPRSVALREAHLEQGLHGVVLRVTGEAPTQGYYAAMLRPVGGGAPDSAGIVSFELVALPPPGPEAVGPARTRVLMAGVFLPTKAIEDLRGFRVGGGGAVETLRLR